MKKIECFVDTNVLLHCLPFKEIPWLSLLAADDVTLTVPSVVVAELEQKKLYGVGSRLRQRAQDALRNLDQWRELDGLVTANVRVRLVAKEPRVDWQTEELDATVRDDRLIAAALAQRLPNVEVYICSNDFGVRIKAEAHGLDVLVIPDEYHLSDIASEAERELVRLRAKLDALERREPRVALGFRTSSGVMDRLELNISTGAEITPTEVDRLVAERAEELNSDLESSRLLGTMAVLTAPSPEGLDRYARMIPAHLAAYRDYLQEMGAYHLRRSLQFELRFVLVNNGTTPAEGLVIDLHIPDGIVVHEGEDEPAPTEPEKPAQPRSALQEILDQSPLRSLQLNYPAIHDLGYLSNFSVNSRVETGPRIRKTSSYEIEYERRSILHHDDEELEPIRCEFESYDDCRSFNIPYRIRARNLAEPTLRKLHVIVTRA